MKLELNGKFKIKCDIDIPSLKLNINYIKWKLMRYAVILPSKYDIRKLFLFPSCF